MSDVLAGLRSIQRAVEDGDAEQSKPTVAYLLGAINATEMPEDKSQLLGFLALEYSRFQMHEKELEALKAAIVLWPDNPTPRIALAGSYLLHQQYDKAREAAESAVTTAEAAGKFRRDALQTLARSLAKLQHFVELEKVIERLMQMKDAMPDSAIETDFLVGLPPDSISDEVRQAYLSLKESRSHK